MSVGLAMVGAGLVAGVNGQERIGAIIALAGSAWLLAGLLQAIPSAPTATLGELLSPLWFAFVVHAVVTFPTGRLISRLERGVVATSYISVGLKVPILLVTPTLSSVSHPERNILALFPSADALRWFMRTADVLTIAWIAVLVGLVLAKAWAAGPAARRAYGLVWVTGTALFATAILIVVGGLGIVPAP